MIREPKAVPATLFKSFNGRFNLLPVSVVATYLHAELHNVSFLWILSRCRPGYSSSLSNQSIAIFLRLSVSMHRQTAIVL